MFVYLMVPTFGGMAMESSGLIAGLRSLRRLKEYRGDTAGQLWRS